VEKMKGKLFIMNVEHDEDCPTLKTGSFLNCNCSFESKKDLKELKKSLEDLKKLGIKCKVCGKPLTLKK
jgi:hypothetical protein